MDAEKVERHMAEAPDPARVHVLKDPGTPVSDRSTVPVGVTAVPGALSVTVTVHDEPSLIATGLAHFTVVDVNLTGTLSDE